MKSNFRTAMKSKSMPWKDLTTKLITDGVVDSNAEFQYELVHYLHNMAEFSIDPKSVGSLDNEKIEKIFDTMKGDIAKLMAAVAPSCKRMVLICRQL